MSIAIDHVFKYYGEQAALNDVSLQIDSGEIVGFLGPNGAGKSTMMKIITCFIPASSGSVVVGGLDVEEASIAVRRKVGYLPEHNPLYTDMYVREYLSFVAGVYRLDNKKARIDDMVHLVGLEREQHKKIRMLSKGYRQRLGLAQAMIHDPEILILDEPTSGLDPHQLEEMRSLILTIGKTKTVMLSTHIMQEVEAVCDRVVIIKEGRIVADDTKTEIRQHSTVKQTIFVEFDKAVDYRQLLRIEGVSSVKQTEHHQWLIECTADARLAIAHYAQEQQLLVLTMRLEEKSMEEVFKERTKS